MKRILVPIDGSDCSGVAIARAKELAGFYGAQIVLLNVYDMPAMRAYFDFGHEQREATVRDDLQRRSRRVLEDGQTQLGDLEPGRFALVSLEGDPADCIIEYACNSENGIDMIVIGSHGMSGLRRALLGSVAHKVVVQTDKPVLVI